MPTSFFSFSGAPKIASLVLLLAGLSNAQISTTAYRVLGQTDFQQIGLNQVTGQGLAGPASVALDARNGQLHVYISDSRNARILAWADFNSYQNGDAPALVLGQPGPQYSGVLGIGNKGLNNPQGIAVNQYTGDLYVADTGDNRVLRFPSPFANLTRIEPDQVYGQPNLNTMALAPASDMSLNHPRAVAVDSGGNLWVADTGNSRVVRYASASLNTSSPSADSVIGQKDFVSALANRGGALAANTLANPAGLAFDNQDNLYVSDAGNTRVLKFPAPLGMTVGTAAATAVWGQPSLTARGVPTQVTNSSLPSPAGLSVDGSGNLYVADPVNNRVLVFPTATSSAAATAVFGQTSLTSAVANGGSFPFSSASTLSGPLDVRVGADGGIFIADTGNNRVLEFGAGSKTARVVFGQSSFSGNGSNQVKPGSLNAPFSMAIDYSQSPFALYVSDISNNRILIWKDSAHFATGAPADAVIGQPDLSSAAPNADTGSAQTPSPTSLLAPAGIAVDPKTGTLYVADSGNNRILRYPRPVDQPGRIMPDAVIGQADFSSSNSAAVTESSLHSPAGVALGPNGDIFVSDSGNNRVLEFPAGSGTLASAIRVFGQPTFNSSARASQTSAQTLNAPQGIAVDASSNLYVADTGDNRVVVFPNTQNAPPNSDSAAFVIGQANFSNSFSSNAAGGLRAPTNVALDSAGNIYVADTGNNRVVEFPSLITLAASGGLPSAVIGQATATGSIANYNSANGLGTAQGLSSPNGLYIDRRDTLYVGDSGNNRVLQFLKPAVVVNAATYQAGVPSSQGGLATLFSANLATDQMQATGNTWPSVLLDRTVQVNDSVPAPLYYFGMNQVNFQVPSSTPLGSERIAVRVADTGELIAGGTLLVGSASPGLFTSNQKGSGQGAIINQDGTLNSSTNPAPKGSTISIYGTGQGQVMPAVPDGIPAPGSPLSNTVAVPTTSGSTCLTTQPSMCVAIGTTFGAVQFSGLAPGFIGLWQINVTIPTTVVPGLAVPIRVVIDGIPSNIVTVAIK